jgi:hypothetical protein
MDKMTGEFNQWYGMSKYTQVIYDKPANRQMCWDGFVVGVKSSDNKIQELRRALKELMNAHVPFDDRPEYLKAWRQASSVMSGGNNEM